MKKVKGNRLCPSCHRASLKMEAGQTRFCPLCGHKWKARRERR